MRTPWMPTLVSAIALTLLAACGPQTEQAAPASSPETPAAPEAAPAPEPAASAFAAVDAERLLNANSEPGQWMSNGRTYDEQRFSPLTDITTENVGELGLAWWGDFDTKRGQESTPLFIDGVLYVTTAWSKVYAYDARTGAELWKFDPQAPGETGAKACCDVVNRGAAAWNGKIYVATIDGRLIAIDAATGQEVWSVVTVDQTQPYTITGAPRVVRGKVVIGNGGAESGVRGYVTAYDAETGEQAWRFYTVPGNPALGFESETMEMAAETWNGEWWAIGGGGTVWDAIVYDEVNDNLLLGVGNGSPWNASVRSPGGGDNLFLSSIVAVDPDTGAYKWHFQEIPWETWDYTATQPIMLADIEVADENGGVAPRRVIMQAPKNGFFYVLDAATGEFISGTNYVPVTWASGLDPETGAPIVNPEARYDVTGEATIVVPSSQGAHSWNPWSYSPDTGLVYLPAMLNSLPYKPDPNFRLGAFNIAVDWISGDYLYDEPGNTIQRGTRGFLSAWDPETQREVWRTEPTLGGSAGALATAGGVVFQGRGQELLAYRADTGEQLWSSGTRAGTAAAPIAYELDGEQYIAVVVGGAQPGGYYAPSLSRLLVYKRGGTATLPEPIPYEQPPIVDVEQFASAEVVAAGQEVYGTQCSICHGANGVTRGMFPDLLRSAALGDQSLFDTIVLEGALAANGMRNFSEVLAAADTEGVRAYLIDRAQAALATQAEAQAAAQAAAAAETDE